MTNQFYNKYFDVMYQKLRSVNISDLEKAADLAMYVSRNGGKIIIAGNGGSAAMASHVSVDFTKAAGIRAINFNEADLLTCFSNDYGYEHWLENALEFYADKDDLAILISSSGESKNILNGSRKALKMEIPLITLSGFGVNNSLCKLGMVNFCVDSKEYNIIEMTHHIWLVSIIDYITLSKNK